MATGGWIYQTYEWPQAIASDYVTSKASFTAMLLEFHKLAGWSQHTARTSYGIYNTSYAISEHTSGAWLVWLLEEDPPGGHTLLHADNQVRGDDFKDMHYGIGLEVAYLPAGHSGLGGVDPYDANFLPADGFLFEELVESSTRSYTNPFRVHFMGRGDDVVIAIADQVDVSTDIDTVAFYGTVLDRLANDPTDTDREAQLCWRSGLAYSSTSQTFQYKKADGTRAPYATEDPSYMSGLLSANVVDRSPWNWVSPTILRASTDLDTDGVIAGCGEKGTVSPEMYRIVNTGATARATLDSGKFIHLGNGFCVGWDPSNGPLV